MAKPTGKTIYVLNGPNLNLLGTREPHIYGRSSLKDVEKLCQKAAAAHDAIKGISVPTVECHISNIHAREPWRNHSYISFAAKAVICGFGIQGYALAIDGVAAMTAKKSKR